MPLKKSRTLSFAQFGEMLQDEWEKGRIGDDIHQCIESGFLPIKLLSERLQWVIEREGDGLRLTVE